MGNNSEITQLDYYQVQIPFYLETDDNTMTSFEGYEASFIIRPFYNASTGKEIKPGIEVMSVIIPNTDGSGASYDPGVDGSDIFGTDYFAVTSGGDIN